MSHTKTAAVAGTPLKWPNALRITEAVVPPHSPQARMETSLNTRMHGGLMKLYAAWRWLEGKRSQQIASKRLRVSETISLGEKRTISIVTVDGAQFLIGSSSGGVQLLTRLDVPTGQPSRIEVSR